MFTSSQDDSYEARLSSECWRGARLRDSNPLGDRSGYRLYYRVASEQVICSAPRFPEYASKKALSRAGSTLSITSSTPQAATVIWPSGIWR